MHRTGRDAAAAQAQGVVEVRERQNGAGAAAGHAGGGADTGALSDEETARYLARIEVVRRPPSDDALAELQRGHLLAVPFENLSIHLGEEIELRAGALVRKIVAGGRGGFCYELNGAFASLLTALGYEVTLLAARVHGPIGLGPPFDHLALRVDLGVPFLVDVGFGRFSTYPLRLDVRTDQHDPAGTFRVEEADGGDLDVYHGDAAQYRLELRPRALQDFEATCWWHRTSPRSPFTRSLVISRLTETGRVTLSDRRLVRTVHDERFEEVLTRDDEVLEAYRREFSLPLSEVPAPRALVGAV